MFSMCSLLTPSARIPDTRIPQLMQPCFTERNKSYAQTSHEASLPQERYMKIERFQREKLIDGIDLLGRKIEFTKNSEFQSGPKVVAPTSMRIR